MTLNDALVLIFGVLFGLWLGRGLWPTGRPVRDIQRLQRRQAADLKIREFADTYSPDMKAGEVYSVPFHMLVTHRQNGGI